MTWMTRIDRHTAHLLDEAISIERASGSVRAWAFLRRNSVSETLIERILVEDESRRPLRFEAASLAPVAPDYQQMAD